MKEEITKGKKKLTVFISGAVASLLVTFGAITPENADTWQAIIVQGVGFLGFIATSLGYFKAQGAVDVEKEKK